MKTRLAFPALILLMILGACVKEEDPVPAAGGDDIMLSVKSSDGQGDTKSTYPDGLNNYITDVNIFVFDQSGTKVSANYYPRWNNISGKELFMQGGHTFTEKFDIYIVSNVGDVHSATALQSISSIEDYVYTFDRNYSTFTSKGFPMASHYTDYCPKTDSRTLLADKLVTQYNISFTKSAGNMNTYTIRSGQIHDIANRITPWEEFAVSSIGTEVTPDGDLFTSTDLAALNRGSAATLFVLENEQGTSFPSTVNTDKLKKEENINSDKRGKCSYVEFHVKVETPTAVFNDVIYRYYFGDNVRDCSIHRNYLCNLVLSFDNVYVEDEGWRIEPGTPVVDQDAMVLSRDRLSIIKGMSNYFTVTCKEDVGYTMSYSSADMSRYGVTLSKSSAGGKDKYTVSTSYSNYTTTNGSIPRVNYADIPITFTTLDGLLQKTFTVRVQLNPVIIQFDFTDGVGTAEVLSCVDWPENTCFVWDISGMLYGENVYCNNRLFDRYTCDIWPTSFNQVKSYAVLQGGDAAVYSYQSIDLKTNSGTGSLQSQMHAINTSHVTDHTYAVGKETNHYTVVGHAYMTIRHGFAEIIGGTIQRTYSGIPVMYYGRQGRVAPGETVTTVSVSTGGSNISLSCRPSKVPAWAYMAANSNATADMPTIVGEWSSTSTYYGVSFTKPSRINMNTGVVTYGFDPDKYYKMNVSGSSRSTYYNPSIGIDVIYSCPSL